ncbi:MAG: hypothetical protein V4718_08325 [Pseudomonadota bacterium]
MASILRKPWPGDEKEPSKYLHKNSAAFAKRRHPPGVLFGFGWR